MRRSETFWRKRCGKQTAFQLGILTWMLRNQVGRRIGAPLGPVEDRAASYPTPAVTDQLVRRPNRSAASPDRGSRGPQGDGHASEA